MNNDWTLWTRSVKVVLWAFSHFGVDMVIKSGSQLFDSIREELYSQDNWATSHPIFMVQEDRHIYGVGESYADHVEYLDEDGETCDIDCAVTVVGVKVIRVSVQPFLTRKGALEYIRSNGHNLKNPDVYAESGHRNHEWQEIRRVFMEKDKTDSGGSTSMSAYDRCQALLSGIVQRGISPETEDETDQDIALVEALLERGPSDGRYVMSDSERAEVVSNLALVRASRAMMGT